MTSDAAHPEHRWVSSPNELLTPSELGTMSGLDFISGIVEGRLPAPPILRLMRARFLEASEGRVVIEATPAFEHYNQLVGVHVGWYGSLLDSALAFKYIRRHTWTRSRLGEL
ncbi:MAG: hypothetical protein AAF565_03630 [Pseudomonadota bacterium]